MTGWISNLSGKICCGATVTGPAHVVRGMPNQDALLYIKKRKYMLLVVSDGMGSKPFADFGAQMACRAVRREMVKFISNKKAKLPVSQLLLNIVERWRQEVLPREAKDCSATCLFVFATKNKILTARLGDGMICLIGKETAHSLAITDCKTNEFANTTHSFSDKYADIEFDWGLYDRNLYRGVVLTTDGISADIAAGAELSFASDLLEQLSSIRPWKRLRFLVNMMQEWPVPNHTDDKTIIVAAL